MKVTDDHDAKFRIWAAESKVWPLPHVSGMPRFKARKFRSYAEMNAWKAELLDRIARQGGVKWTK
jgi:hypothetical protein